MQVFVQEVLPPFGEMTLLNTKAVQFKALPLTISLLFIFLKSVNLLERILIFIKN